MKSGTQATAGQNIRPSGFWFDDLTSSGRTDSRSWMVATTRSIAPSSIVPPLLELFNAYLTAERVVPVGLATECVALGAIGPVVGDMSTAKAVRKAHEDSGLTWEQLARVFSVSRRSVHLWANGGRMNATNVEMLMSFVDLVNHMNAATPIERRAALLAINEDGQTVLDIFRSRYSARRGNLSTEPRPDWYLGALHGDVSD
jgi:hypothetical protein